MKRIILGLTILCAFSLFGCTDAPNAKRHLEADGVKEIKITGHSLGCGEDDFYATGFTGVKNEKKVSGVVCAGTFKGATIRYF